MKRSEAKAFINAILSLREGATDQLASTAVGAYPSLAYDGTLVPVGTRINFNGAIKRARVDLWDTEANNPENAPDMWDSIEYRDGIRLIPETIVAENPFMAGELGWWGDKLYKSLIDANVYTPEAYPAGWEVQE